MKKTKTKIKTLESEKEETVLMKNLRKPEWCDTKTICALATAAGTGGIAVIRVSGKDALKNALKVLKTDEKVLKPNVMVLTKVETKNISDEVMAVYFKAPKSYTGEDVVEIHCHGNTLIAAEIIKALIEKGCAAAENGEFTKRAFLNGRIDLSAAEGVIDLINSESAAQSKAAYNAVKGETYKKINSLQEQIVKMTAAVNAAIDYPEEGIEEAARGDISAELDKIIEKLDTLKKGYENGKSVREGIRITIAGEPNTGKSTLLNALLGYERAIVTSLAGTTRDTLEESLLYKGIKFIFTDTAGLRETDDEAERLGVVRSREALHSADIVLLVSDYGKESAVGVKEFDGKRVIEVINKIDKLSVAERGKLKCDNNKIYISAANGENIESLKELILKTAGVDKIHAGGEGINNARQQEAVVNSLCALRRARENLYAAELDFILSDLNEAWRALGKINGKTASDTVVNEIFARFCVGK